MIRRLAVLALVGCSSPAPRPAPPVAPKLDPEFATIATAVGPSLRAVGHVDLRGPGMPRQLEGIFDALPAFGGKLPADCHASLARLRIAIGEPLRIAAEIDGDVDAARLPCILGARLYAMMAQARLVVRDRPGGLSITRDAAPGTPDPALVSRCEGASCLAVELGPRAHRVTFAVSFGATTRFALGGLDASGLARAVDATFGPGFPVALRAHGDLLTGEVSRDADPAWAARLKERLLEAFRIPSSSMLPTLVTGDNIFVAKGPLAGPLAAGDVVVYRLEDRTYVKRIAALGGQRIEETADGIAIDGAPLPIAVVDPAFEFGEDDPMRGEHVERVGALVRESAGARSYLTLRTGPPRELKSWTVPAGHVFLLGDNRNNSNDSRYTGAIPEADVIGRVVGVWLVWRGDAPDWDRMGQPVE